MDFGNDDAKQSVLNGGGHGRRKSKMTQMKIKQRKRGLGVQQLEEIIHSDPRRSSSYPPPLPTLTPGFPSSSYAAAGVQYIRPTLEMLVPGVGIHGANMHCRDYVMDPSAVGSNDAGFLFENFKAISSTPNFVKCGSDGCVVCHKNKRGNNSDHFSVTPFGSFGGNHTIMDINHMMDRNSQVTGDMSAPPGYLKRGIPLIEHEFFPVIKGGQEEYKRQKITRMGSSATKTTAWCGSGTLVAGQLALQCGEGSCVTSITSNDEGSVSSPDLSLKLSY